MAKKLI
ncbi:uncharacterized protein FFM5_15340 [Fusarium fujikuroi]|nr:uncharacterized protein FFM5_15340 [Fusarium fujikuroi]